MESFRNLCHGRDSALPSELFTYIPGNSLPDHTIYYARRHKTIITTAENLEPRIIHNSGFRVQS